MILMVAKVFIFEFEIILKNYSVIIYQGLNQQIKGFYLFFLEELRGIEYKYVF